MASREQVRAVCEERERRGLGAGHGTARATDDEAGAAGTDARREHAPSGARGEAIARDD